MGTLTSSGYLVSTATVAWASGQTLDSLTNDEWADVPEGRRIGGCCLGRRRHVVHSS